MDPPLEFIADLCGCVQTGTGLFTGSDGLHLGKTRASGEEPISLQLCTVGELEKGLASEEKLRSEQHCISFT